MNEKRRLILKTLNLLSTIENDENQSRIREIEGLLYEIMNMED